MDLVASLGFSSFGGLWAGWPAKGSAKKRKQSQEEKPINSIQQKNEIMNAVLLGGSQLMELIY